MVNVENYTIDIFHDLLYVISYSFFDRDTLKKKLDVDFRQYRILGACNPPFAYKALQAESKIGSMLPCNVIVQQREDGKVEVSAIDPIASMQSVKNDNLLTIAKEVQEKLKKVVANV